MPHQVSSSCCSVTDRNSNRWCRTSTRSRSRPTPSPDWILGVHGSMTYQGALREGRGDHRDPVARVTSVGSLIVHILLDVDEPTLRWWRRVVQQLALDVGCAVEFAAFARLAEG